MSLKINHPLFHGVNLKKMILFFTLLSTQAFAQTECYFDNDFQDGTTGFILQDKSITLIGPNGHFNKIEKDGKNLLNAGEVVGELKMFFPRGIIELGDELSSFKCTVWRTGGRG